MRGLTVMFGACLVCATTTGCFVDDTPAVDDDDDGSSGGTSSTTSPVTSTTTTDSTTTVDPGTTTGDPTPTSGGSSGGGTEGDTDGVPTCQCPVPNWLCEGFEAAFPAGPWTTLVNIGNDPSASDASDAPCDARVLSTSVPMQGMFSVAIAQLPNVITADRMRVHASVWGSQECLYSPDLTRVLRIQLLGRGIVPYTSDVSLNANGGELRLQQSAGDTIAASFATPDLAAQWIEVEVTVDFATRDTVLTIDGGAPQAQQDSDMVIPEPWMDHSLEIVLGPNRNESEFPTACELRFDNVWVQPL